MKVEIFSDVVCPWCAIGKRRFETALERFDHRDDVQITWCSFELDTDAPTNSHEDVTTHLASKYGMTRDQAVAAQDRLAQTAALEGLTFNFDRTSRANTFDAHRLLHYAGELGVQGELKERLFQAYFTEGKAIGDRATLADLGAQVGLDEIKVTEILESDRYGEEVRSDEQEARNLGISGVPFFVIDRQFGISGAQSADVILRTLDEAWTKTHPFEVVGGDGASCEGDSCAI